MPPPRGARGAPFGGRVAEPSTGSPSSGVVFGGSSGKAVQSLFEGACTSGVLRLANRGLTELPPQLFHLRDVDYQNKTWWAEVELTVLDLSHNSLASLNPPGGEHDQDQGESIHDESVFTTLKSLLASHNQITVFPAALMSSLRSLTKLDLSHNQLDAFPTSPPPAECVPYLQEVDLSFNKLRSISGFAQCCQLSLLRLNDNQLSTFELNEVLPVGRGIPCFPNLRQVTLTNNSLTNSSFPASIFSGSDTLVEIDLSRNNLGEIFVEDSSRRQRIPLLPPTVQVVNLRQNRIRSLDRSCLQCPQLRDLQLGVNRIALLPPDCFADCPGISILDLSNNALCDISPVATLLQLRRLDLQNNNISSLPPRMAALRSLTAMVLDGNPLRGLRREIVEKGTVEVIKYLRTRLTDAEINELGLSGPEAKGPQIEMVNTNEAPGSAYGGPMGGGGGDGQSMYRSRPQRAPQRTPFEVGGGPPAPAGGREGPVPRGKGCRANESSVNLFGPPPEPETRSSVGSVKLIHVGDRTGGLWDLSQKKKATPKTFRLGLGGSGAGGSSAGSSESASTAPPLPTVLTAEMNFSILHNWEEGQAVRTLRLNGQQQVQYITGSFLSRLSNLQELEADGCALGQSSRGDGGIELTPEATPSTLNRLTLSNCQFQGFLPLFQQALPLCKITRVDLHCNSISELPSSLPALAPTLQYLDLSENKLRTFPRVLLSCHQLLELQLNRNALIEFDLDTGSLPGDVDPQLARRVGTAEACWPQLSLLDLSFNDLVQIPLTLAFLSNHLRSLKLEGNRLKMLRHGLLEKGTLAVLEYLQSRIPTAE